MRFLVRVHPYSGDDKESFTLIGAFPLRSDF